MNRIVLLLLCLLFLPGAAIATGAADAAERLERFLREMDSFSATFEQVVTDADDEILQRSSGTVDLARPDRFVWDYREPFHQVILADGELLWVYDVDLEQVMVREMDAALGEAPITLLSGHRPLTDDFTVSESGRFDGLEWVALEPKGDGGDFSMIEMGLDEAGINTLILHDRLGQKTWIRLGGMVVNPDFPATRFRFEAPPGVDIIRD